MSSFSTSLKAIITECAGRSDRGRRAKPLSHFAQRCEIDVKYLRRWIDDHNLPSRDNLEKIKIGLGKCQVVDADIKLLEDSWIKAKRSKTSVLEGNRAQITSTSIGSFSIENENYFPKLCFLNLDIPTQGASPDDFFVVGELRFSTAPDIVDKVPVRVGIRRAVLVPIARGCRLKPASIHRSPQATAIGDDGAGQTTFVVGNDDPSAVLYGDQLGGATLGHFISDDVSGVDEVAVDVYVQIESATDIRLTFVDELRGRSKSQLRLAQNWIARQLVKSIQEDDGSLRISACSIAWRR